AKRPADISGPPTARRRRAPARKDFELPPRKPASLCRAFRGVLECPRPLRCVAPESLGAMRPAPRASRALADGLIHPRMVLGARGTGPHSSWARFDSQ